MSVVLEFFKMTDFEIRDAGSLIGEGGRGLKCFFFRLVRTYVKCTHVYKNIYIPSLNPVHT